MGLGGMRPTRCTLCSPTLCWPWLSMAPFTTSPPLAIAATSAPLFVVHVHPPSHSYPLPCLPPGAGLAFGVWLNLEDKSRRFPLLNLPESRISQLVERYGDLAKVSQTKEAGDDDDLTVGLLDGQQTPTLYDVRAKVPLSAWPRRLCMLL